MSPQLEYVQNFNLCHSFFTNESERSTEVEESSEPENSDDKTSDLWCKNDKKPSHEPFLGTAGLKIVTDN